MKDNSHLLFLVLAFISGAIEYKYPESPMEVWGILFLVLALVAWVINSVGD